ncbi:folate-binding protein YgfZ [Marinobacter salinexigens]|uniref:Folate-binding protein YgfZ n=1 Tax=Marinobacter salinexigens TaxID=2919747 RepID=A0A5B0VD89_9GAMM|nr:folate-binding protein YgfZ [Marinobacter salinexigens]KAA1172011.1 folate-binding protein YgfZ [Marinobacter salinexigens]
MTDTETAVSAKSQLTSSPLPDIGWANLKDQVIVRISGPGTDKFLQGQFSQHLDEVVSGHSPRAAAATPKGRTYCLTRMVRDGDDVLLSLRVTLAEPTLQQLRKYMMLFRGTSAEVQNTAMIRGILGDELARNLAGDAVESLQEPGDSVALESGYLIRVEPTAEGLQRFEFWQLASAPANLDPVREVSLEDWQGSEVAAGIASLTESSVEAFVPQMLNWQHVGGVHFKKGCYTGQEVIARMHFLGQLKKSLFRVAAHNADSTPRPGGRLLSGDRAVGDVVNSVAFQDGHHELLAVIRHDAINGELTLEDSPGAALTILPLPYTVPERDNAAPMDT